MVVSGVKGARLFGRYMEGLEDSYTVIGGTACDILLRDADLEFRATKDIDVVLLAENRLPEVGRAIWRLVKDGGYRCGWKGSEKAHFYRFTDPTQEGFPEMIELFGKDPGFLEDIDGLTIVPIPLDEEASSLSAILLDRSYYTFMMGCRKLIGGIMVLDEAGLIPFKAKAHLDLASRRARGEQIDSRDIKKHAKDVFRLVQILDPRRRVVLPDSIREDMADFCRRALTEKAPLKQMGLHTTVERSVGVIQSVYRLD